MNSMFGQRVAAPGLTGRDHRVIVMRDPRAQGDRVARTQRRDEAGVVNTSGAHRLWLDVVRDVDATYRYVLPGMPNRQRGKPPVPAPASARVSEPADLTAPMLVIVPGPPPAPRPINAALWGRFA